LIFVKKKKGKRRLIGWEGKSTQRAGGVIVRRGGGDRALACGMYRGSRGKCEDKKKERTYSKEGRGKRKTSMVPETICFVKWEKTRGKGQKNGGEGHD